MVSYLRGFRPRGGCRGTANTRVFFKQQEGRRHKEEMGQGQLSRGRFVDSAARPPLSPVLARACLRGHAGPGCRRTGGARGSGPAASVPVATRPAQSQESHPGGSSERRGQRRGQRRSPPVLHAQTPASRQFFCLPTHQSPRRWSPRGRSSSCPSGPASRCRAPRATPPCAPHRCLPCT